MRRVASGKFKGNKNTPRRNSLNLGCDEFGTDSQMLYAGQSAKPSVPFLFDFVVKDTVNVLVL